MTTDTIPSDEAGGLREVPSRNRRFLTNNLFIHPENQTLLWNLMQESPYWPLFSRNTDAQQWFRGMMSAMHQLHPVVSTVEELRRVNSEVVTICSKHMKEKGTHGSIKGSAPQNFDAPNATFASHGSLLDPPFQPPVNSINANPANARPTGEGWSSTLSMQYNPEKQKELRLAEAKANFDAFQERYNAGLAKPQPPVLNLGINLDEPKITNMEELVKQHLESRNALQVPAWDTPINAGTTM